MLLDSGCFASSIRCVKLYVLTYIAQPLGFHDQLVLDTTIKTQSMEEFTTCPLFHGQLTSVYPHPANKVTFPGLAGPRGKNIARLRYGGCNNGI